MGLFGNQDLERRVTQLEAQVSSLMRLIDAEQAQTWQQQSELVPSTSRFPALPEVDVDVARILANGKKIEAIKVAREKYGLGLKEAKDYVEQMPDLR
jgi:ribosomal protein L7/L12